VAQHLLDAAQVGAPFEQVGGGGVPEPVRAGIGGHPGRPQPLVHHPPRGARVEAATPQPEEQRGAAGPGDQDRPAGLLPLLDGPDRRDADRHRALLAALAEHPDRPPPQVERAGVEPAQLADPDPGRVQQLEDGPVPQGDRALGRGPVRRRLGHVGGR
jgi:hypothetical protein